MYRPAGYKGMCHYLLLDGVMEFFAWPFPPFEEDARPILEVLGAGFKSLPVTGLQFFNCPCAVEYPLDSYPKHGVRWPN
jgi:hypothetical protein